jgi:GT2 family glycosyltransferase
MGAAMLVRLESLETVGYFDERFFCYYEETDWCIRARGRGWFIAVSGESLVHHRAQGSDRNANSVYYMIRNPFLFRGLGTTGSSQAKSFISIYRKLRSANEARRTGKMDESVAIIAGLWDGLRGRFGERGAPPPRAIVFLAAHFWIFPSGFFRRGAQRLGSVLRSLDTSGRR